MQRKVFNAEFKAKVALEALAGRKTVNEIVGVHEVHPNQVTTWKREAQEGLKALFERKRGRRRPQGNRAMEGVDRRRIAGITESGYQLERTDAAPR